MPTVVMKFGGSSVADLTRLRQVARIVAERKRGGDRVVVVVSAMGKTTDGLIAQAREVAPTPPRRELDMLVTAGERIAMALLSMAIHEAGAEAVSFTGSQSGIITEDQHQGARILEVRPHRLAEALERGLIVIVAGFQGVSTSREITTLGRGGSDTTAVALAAALAADSCEIYSDVDGVYSADPNVVSDAKLLPELRYEVMQTMAGTGAKVLNADAVEFARRAGIAIHARKTGDTSNRETVVSSQAHAAHGVTAVVGASAVSRLVGPAQHLGELLVALAPVGGRVMRAVTSADRAELLIDRTNVPGKDAAAIAQVAARHSYGAETVGLVSLVGIGLAGRVELLPRALAASAVASLGAWIGDDALQLVVEASSVDAVVRRVHAAFMG